MQYCRVVVDACNSLRVALKQLFGSGLVKTMKIECRLVLGRVLRKYWSDGYLRGESFPPPLDDPTTSLPVGSIR